MVSAVVVRVLARRFAVVEVPSDWSSATVELLDESGAVLDTIELDSLTLGG